MIKGVIQQEDITYANSYASNVVAPKYIKHILKDLKGEIDSDTIIVGDFNTPLTPMDRSSRQKIKKKTLALNNMLDKLLTDIYKAFHLKATEYTFFSSAQNSSYVRSQNMS